MNDNPSQEPIEEEPNPSTTIHTEHPQTSDEQPPLAIRLTTIQSTPSTSSNSPPLLLTLGQIPQEQDISERDETMIPSEPPTAKSSSHPNCVQGDPSIIPVHSTTSPKTTQPPNASGQPIADAGLINKLTQTLQLLGTLPPDQLRQILTISSSMLQDTDDTHATRLSLIRQVVSDLPLPLPLPCPLNPSPELLLAAFQALASTAAALGHAAAQRLVEIREYGGHPYRLLFIPGHAGLIAVPILQVRRDHDGPTLEQLAKLSFMLDPQ
eukprot:gnl/Dysnectes_brevis/4185_a5527_807.p1 GENE.gnl/Dysnectes_brevis/4185_a5527_807~~gnl/Dysnectes_brevis/4185_a5527_807.p1  ORF type:complete len:267 (-),score=70.64 gnl/Dysnectes_brevis/4185_a5527_807:98-898(-)